MSGTRRCARRSSDIGGAGLLLLAGGCAAVCAGAAVLVLFADVSLARARAQTAADGAALAAVSATTIVGGDGAACAAAEQVAAANGAELEGCRPPGETGGLTAQVRVTVAPSAPAAWFLPPIAADAAAGLRPARAP